MAANNDIQLTWKRRPSEIRGYERAMYTTLENGDYIRVDYNTGEKIVRIYTEILEDKGASYYAIINKGRVTIEKNNNGRATRVAERLSEKAEEFSSLPNKDVLKLINNNYGISKSGFISKNVKKEERLKIEREEVKRKYFKPDENPYIDNSYSSQKRIKKIGIIDLFDTLTGIVISGLFFFLGQYDLIAAGAAAVIWGMLLGVFDILLREREPVFSKIFFFLLSGVGIYFYSYLYL
jgi:hypothetical protein